MVDLLFIADSEALSKPGTVRSLYDPTAGTGGMLSVAEEYLRVLNPKAELVVYGQELTHSPMRSVRPTCSSRDRTYRLATL